MKKQQNLNALHTQIMQEYRQASEITGLMIVSLNTKIVQFRRLAAVDFNVIMGERYELPN